MKRATASAAVTLQVVALLVAASACSSRRVPAQDGQPGRSAEPPTAESPAHPVAIGRAAGATIAGERTSGDAIQVSRTTPRMGASSLTFGGTTVVLNTNVFFTDPRDGSRQQRSVEIEMLTTPRLKTVEAIFRRLRSIGGEEEHHLGDDLPPELQEILGEVEQRDSVFAPYGSTIHIDGLRLERGWLFFEVDRAFVEVFDEGTWNGEWTCVNCAEYVEMGDPVSRIIKTVERDETRHTLSIEDLDCSPLGAGGLECVDPQVGAYGIPWSLVRVIDAGARFPVTMQVSHFRNLDFRSVTFRQTTVEVATNVFLSDLRATQRRILLGRFETPMTPRLASIASQFRSLRGILRATTHNSPPHYVIPHAPVVYVDEQRAYYRHFEFPNIESTFLSTIDEVLWNSEWTCVECAEYWRTEESIARVVGDADAEEPRRTWRTFSIDELDCRPLNYGRLDCVDPQFGNFEIPWGDDGDV